MFYLRFIPDNVTFDDKPKDEASEVNVAAYKPKYFTSAAMGTSKVSLQCFCNVFLICLVLLSVYESYYISSGKKNPDYIHHFEIKTSKVLKNVSTLRSYKLQPHK